MCNLSQRLFREGFKWGFEEGYVIEYRRVERQKIENAIQAVMQKLHLSREEARELLDLPAENK